MRFFQGLYDQYSVTYCSLVACLLTTDTSTVNTHDSGHFHMVRAHPSRSYIAVNSHISILLSFHEDIMQYLPAQVWEISYGEDSIIEVNGL